ncbi:unnamed protein product, partial [Iphiclides podalirius]
MFTRTRSAVRSDAPPSRAASYSRLSFRALSSSCASREGGLGVRRTAPSVDERGRGPAVDLSRHLPAAGANCCATVDFRHPPYTIKISTGTSDLRLTEASIRSSEEHTAVNKQ